MRRAQALGSWFADAFHVRRMVATPLDTTPGAPITGGFHGSPSADLQLSYAYFDPLLSPSQAVTCSSLDTEYASVDAEAQRRTGPTRATGFRLSMPRRRQPQILQNVRWAFLNLMQCAAQIRHLQAWTAQCLASTPTSCTFLFEN